MPHLAETPTDLGMSYAEHILCYALCAGSEHVWRFHRITHSSSSLCILLPWLITELPCVTALLVSMSGSKGTVASAQQQSCYANGSEHVISSQPCKLTAL